MAASTGGCAGLRPRQGPDPPGHQASNVIVTEEKRPVLTDFGLVKSTQEVSTTTTGVVLGSLEYMAPEQIQGKEATPATDQYALGWWRTRC